jgi:photosystem II stability/assembly factor-like uncharacterized protein
VSTEPAPRAQPFRIGGGGYVTGLALDPFVPDRVFARCDVGGVFRSDDGGRAWRPVNRGMFAAHHHMVQSVAVDPVVPGRAFRASGDARGGRRFGTIHRTDDAGATWHELTDVCDFFGNGPTRMMGEAIACSPSEPDVVWAGAYATGAWRSGDGGATWRSLGLAGARITVVAPHPHDPARLYVATCSDRVFAVVERGSRWAHEDTAAKCRRYSDARRGDRGALMTSTDGGARWAVALDGPDVTELAFGPDGTLYATTLGDGILRSTDDGRSWEAMVTGLPVGMSFHALTIDGEGTLYTAPDARPGDEHLAPVPVYVSDDRGQRWRLVRRHVDEDLRRYPSYLGRRHAGWAISTLRACPRVPGRLFLANWYGVARSDDGGLTWDAHGFEGIETTCGEGIAADPHAPATVHVALADHRPMVSRDAGGAFGPLRMVGERLPAGAADATSADASATDATAVAASRHHPGVVWAGLTGRSAAARPALLVRSVDGGGTGHAVHAFGRGLFVQALVEDPRRPGRLHAFLDGALADGAGLYRSEDGGSTWRRREVAFPSHLRTFPHRAAWIDGDLMPVVGYQIKNACGTNRHLCVDPHRDDAVYVGEWTEGVFRVGPDDEVASIGDGLPFGAGPETALAVLRCDPVRPETLWAGFTREGLWCTRDGGGTWAREFPSDDAPCHVTCLALSDDGATIAVAGEPLAGSSGRVGVWASPDAGASWRELDASAYGALRWKGIAFGRDAGWLYAVTCGSGGFRFELGPQTDARRGGREGHDSGRMPLPVGAAGT